jgi:hypothetical protein
MIVEKTVRKYLAVQALAQQGSPGERDNAARILTRLEQESPGIRQVAADYVRKQQPPPAPQGPAAPPGVHYKTPQGPPAPRGGTGNWENIFQYAAGWYTEFTSSVLNTVLGLELARQAKTQTKLNRSGDTVLITLRVPISTLQDVERLNPGQRVAFEQAIRAMVDAELSALFEEE